MELRVATDEAREHVVLELWMDGKPLGHINFDGATVEKHIQDVGDMRAELNETVTPELEGHCRAKLEGRGLSRSRRPYHLTAASGPRVAHVHPFRGQRKRDGQTADQGSSSPNLVIHAMP